MKLFWKRIIQNRSKKRSARTLLASLLSLLLAVSFAMPLTAAAAEDEFPDLNRKGSISIVFKYYDENTKEVKYVSGGNSVGLYKVADVVVDNGFKFVVDERFASAGEIPSTDKELDEANKSLALKMEEIAQNYDYDAGPIEMDENGQVKFEDLGVGLYLVVQAQQGTGDNKFEISSFLISIPCRNQDGSLSYDVSADSKPVTIAYNNEPTPEPEPKPVPQTGQLWWPVLALGAAGALFVLVGAIRKSRG